MKVDESELIRRILSRDRRALSIFYHTYAPIVTRYVIGKIDNRMDADEVIADTLFAFLESLRDFTGSAKLSTYIVSIAHHKTVDFYRRKKIKSMVFSRIPSLEKLVSPLLTPEELYESKAFARNMKIVLSGILPKYRDALLLKYREGRSVRDIAKVFATSVKGAECVLSRARKAFMSEYSKI